RRRRTRKGDAIVQTEWTVVPKLEFQRRDAPAAPARWARYRADDVFCCDHRDRLLEGEPAFEWPALFARPGAELRLLRPRRASGIPAASTVARVSAVGSFGSAFAASLNHSENSRKGSVRSVKSPDVNEFPSLMVAESVIGPECLQLRAAWFNGVCRPPYKGWDAPRLSGLAGGAVAMVCLGFALGGCSIPLG